jgi:DNA-binding NarL/FixJ family response regulator
MKAGAANQSRMAIRILIADDEPAFRAFVRTLLGASATVIGEAENADQAVELASSARPDVVLVDLELPGLDGPEVARRIKAALPEARVLLLTSHDEEAYLAATGKTGADALLPKREVRTRILSAIERRGQSPPAPGPREWDHHERRRRGGNAA